MTQNLFNEAVAAPHKQRAELTFKGNLKQSRHGWLRLTPAYSLHLVQEILSTCDKKKDMVLDPFSGTGTTALASVASGITAHSVDINPFLVWLGNLKLTRFTRAAVAAARSEGQRIVGAMRRHTTSGEAWLPDLHQIEKWWDAPTLAALAQLFAYVDEHDDTRDLLRIAFCKTMIEVANVSFAHQSMSFKQRRTNGNELPFPGTAELDTIADVCNRFETAVQRVVEDAGKDQPMVNGRVFRGDSRDLTSVLPRADYTKVITSPPYPNRMSYIRELRPYMYWLKFLTDGRQAGELDWQAIGGTWGCATSNLAKWQRDPASPIPFAHFDPIVASISADHHLLGAYVARYFEDIKEHLSSLARVLASGAEVYYIVGNSKFYDTMLPVEEIYSALLQDIGLENVVVEKIRKRSSKKELFEFVVRGRNPR